MKTTLRMGLRKISNKSEILKYSSETNSKTRSKNPSKKSIFVSGGAHQEIAKVLAKEIPKVSPEKIVG